MKDFVQLGNYITRLLEEDDIVLSNVCQEARNHNGWFDEKYVRFALSRWAEMLTEKELMKIIPDSFPSRRKNVLIIGAGNIPMAAFHDIVCVLLTGHVAMIKLSADDSVLIPFLLEELMKINPERKEQILYSDKPLGKNKPDAVLASGSDASEKIFLEYFGNMPHIIRKSKTGVAVLNGNESTEDLKELGKDVFIYFGLGCRNVTTLLLPYGFSLSELKDAWLPYYDHIYNKKYANNYDYYKSVFALNKIPCFDGGFFLMKEEINTVFSPPSVLNYCFYSAESEKEEFIQKHREKIQVLVGNEQECPFGFAQYPVINDFPDKINTIEFLVSL